MIRNFKALGFALAAMLTMGIYASSAAAVEIHSGATSTTIHGNQEGINTFVLDSGTLECKVARLHGSVSGSTSSATELAPTYDECVSTGFIESNATLHTNGCKYNLTANTSNEMLHITGCDAGKPGIVVTTPFCAVTITPQTIGPVDYETAGTAGTTHEVIINSTVANIAYHELGFACKNSGATTTGGQLTGKQRLTATNSATGAHVGLTVE